MIAARRPRAKAFVKSAFFNQERKSEARRRSDTVVVPTVNDADRRPAEASTGCAGRPRETRVSGFRGEYGRKAET